VGHDRDETSHGSSDYKPTRPPALLGLALTSLWAADRLLHRPTLATPFVHLLNKGRRGKRGNVAGAFHAVFQHCRGRSNVTGRCCCVSKIVTGPKKCASE
jgi:hypothetical protein